MQTKRQKTLYKTWFANYYVNNKEKIKLRHKKWYKENKKDIILRQKKWYNKHIEHLRLYWLKRYYKYHKQTWRYSTGINVWKKAVWKRDNYTCQDCGKTHCLVHAHHIKSAKEYPKLRLYINNGITLCKKCHFKRHYFWIVLCLMIL